MAIRKAEKLVRNLDWVVIEGELDNETAMAAFARYDHAKWMQKEFPWSRVRNRRTGEIEIKGWYG